MTHAFKNSGDERVGALNIGAPGGFEERMPGIVAYFEAQPPGQA